MPCFGDGMEELSSVCVFVPNLGFSENMYMYMTVYDIYRIFLGYEWAIDGIQWDNITNNMICGFVSGYGSGNFKYFKWENDDEP